MALTKQNSLHSRSSEVLSTEELLQFLDASTDGVAKIDRDWRTTYVNRTAKKLLSDSEDILGKTCWECFPLTLHEGSPWVRYFHMAMDWRKSTEFEEFYPGPLNMWLHLDVKPVEDGIIVYFRDVTEAKKTALALIQNEKLAAVGRLASSIAHEINNPLESVTNLLYLATTSQPLHPEVREYLETAERELRRVAVITNQTLRFYQQTTNPTCVACEDVIGAALLMYQGKLVNSNVKVNKRKRARKPVMCYEGDIRQVLNNLIGNAIDSMQAAGGHLSLRSREGMDWRTDRRGLVITVADTGSGMDEKTRKKIFEPFFSTKGIGGTGLGLWISHEIIERHKGYLRVRSSQRQGKSGTVISLFLPYEAAVR